MIESLVREQYGRSVDLLERGRLTKGIIIPSEAECIDILEEHLTDEQIIYLQEKIRRPIFQIVPEKPFVDFENALDLGMRGGQCTTYVSPHLRERFSKMPASRKIQIGLVEGQARLPSTPLIKFLPRKQEELYKKSLPEGVKVIHPRHYALLQLDELQAGEFIDVDYWTPLEDNSDDRTKFPVGFWGVGRVSFRELNHGFGGLTIRWRSSVMIPAN